MRKKVILVCASFLLAVIFAGMILPSFIGWRPFKDYDYFEIDKYISLDRVDTVLLERNAVERTKTFYFVNLLRETKVYAHNAEYDPAAMMYFVYTTSDHYYQYHRIGVALDPKPIIDIDGKVFRIKQEIAEKYQYFWENYDVNGYFKVGS